MTATGNPLGTLVAEPRLTKVPVVFNAMTALMAEAAGFPAAYVGGATLGYMRGVTEAALTPHDFCEIGLEISSVARLPLIADGGCGWGDPMHLRRNIRLVEQSGYAAIEIEDQVAPKRAHHHIGIEHLVPIETMVAKIEEAARARRSDILIIARTNSARVDMDDALRRCEAYARAGADLIFPITGDIEQIRLLGERAPLPLAQMVFPGRSFGQMGLSEDDLVALNYRLLIDGVTPFAAMYEALRASYDGLRTAPPATGVVPAMEAANALVGLPELLEIERRTTERGS